VAAGDEAGDEAWGGVPAWRIKNLRLALIEAEQRGADPGDEGDGLDHRALRRRFARGRRALEAIARNFGLFRSLARRSAYFSANDRAWVATFLMHYVAFGRLSDRQAQVLHGIARRWGVKGPVKDAFAEWAPRVVKVEAPPPRRVRPAAVTRRLAAHRVTGRKGEEPSLVELLEAGLAARGLGRRSPSRLLQEAVRAALDEDVRDEAEGEDEGY
jgi:hypothetical protein